jgi:inosose dehydratase
MTTRRDFVVRLSAGLAVAMPSQSRQRALFSLAEADAIRFGYAAITWGGEDERAIEDIAAVGFPGIQLRASVLTRFGDRPRELRDLLARKRLTFVALSSGNVSIDPAVESSTIAEHVSHAKFLRDAGGLYLQLIDERPKGRAVESADYVRLGKVLTEIGKETSALGVQVAYHPHMGSIGEKPNDIDRVLDSTDPRYVHLLLDVAHFQAGGGDPVAAVRRYKDRLLFLHIKDVRRPPGGGPSSYQFVELGRGAVDLRGVFAALRDVGFKGWAVVELDSVSVPSESPKEAAAGNKRYLEKDVGAHIS